MRVRNYETGADLSGRPSQELVEASLTKGAGGPGAVLGYRGPDGEWQLIPHDWPNRYPGVLTVFVEEE